MYNINTQYFIDLTLFLPIIIYPVLVFILHKLKNKMDSGQED